MSQSILRNMLITLLVATFLGVLVCVVLFQFLPTLLAASISIVVTNLFAMVRTYGLILSDITKARRR
jgi:VIT1/CCC1 family predicted Fe2+/Mn2+ transporter